MSVSLSDRFWSKVAVGDLGQCWLWTASVRNAKKVGQDYGAFWKDGRHQPASRIAFELANGIEVPSEFEICHTCDRPRCCNFTHLFLGDVQTNVDDKVAKGRHVHGERVWTVVLSEAQVLEIRSFKPAVGRAPAGLRQELADRFDIRIGLVSEIWGNKSWKHL